MKLVGIIPCRYTSSRFPGKSLEKIGGVPVFVRVYLNAKQFDSWSKLIVATDDSRISDVCDEYSIPYVMTEASHADCIDRVAEVSEKIEGDRYVIIQGDEPFFDIRTLDVDFSPSVVNFYTRVSDIKEIDDPNVVKVVVSKNLKAIYFSRYAIPYSLPRTRKSSDVINVDKQVGVYSFSKDALKQFRSLRMSYLEGIEGIGLLRFLENDIDVHMRYAQKDSISIDTPEDLKRANKIYEKK